MNTTLGPDLLRSFHERLARASLEEATQSPGGRATRQPVQTLYGGAHLFTEGTAVHVREGGV